jgi:hypothetical protein
MGDEMRPDQAIRCVATDEEAHREKPELAAPHGFAQRRAPRIVRLLRRGERGALADGSLPDITGAVAHEDHERHDGDGCRAEEERDRGTPAHRHGERGHRRHEHQLTGGGRSAEESDDEPAMRSEPALRDRGARDLSRRARAEADHDPPDHVQLPELADVDERDETRADEQDPSG